jgi:hypothetical protein
MQHRRALRAVWAESACSRGLLHTPPRVWAETDPNFFNRAHASREGAFPLACAWFKQALTALIIRFSVALPRRCRSASSAGGTAAALSALGIFAFRRRLSAQSSQLSKSAAVSSETRFAASCGLT